MGNLLRVALGWVARLLLAASIDAIERQVIQEAITRAELSGESGPGKMLVAIKHIRREGTESLRRVSESRLRTIVESQLDRIYPS